MSTYTIGNAANIPLNEQMGTIPNMGTALTDWFQNMTFGQVVKTTVGFQVVETVVEINFRGIVQPLSGRELVIKPEGERKWNWITVHAQALPNGALLDVSVDDTIIYLGTQYRVMTRRDYAMYSYVYYELISDYTGSGPTPV